MTSRKYFISAAAAPALVLAWAAPAMSRTRTLPDPWSLVQKSLAGSPYPYRGKLTFSFFLGKSEKRSRAVISFSPPGLIRREILGPDGKVKEIAVSNGRREWIYDKTGRRYWDGAAPGEPDATEEYKKLRANYAARFLGAERAGGRRCWKLGFYSKKDGALSRLSWLDHKYAVVLKSQIFRPDGTLFSETAFEKVRFFIKKPPNPKWFVFRPPKKARPAQAPRELKAAAGLPSASGPATPSWLPFGYALQGIQKLLRQGQDVVWQKFSDGMNALSLFECPKSVSLDFGSGPSEAVLLPAGRGRLRWTGEGGVLDWVHGDTRFVLVGLLEKDDLVKIAGSLR